MTHITLKAWAEALTPCKARTRKEDHIKYIALLVLLFIAYELMQTSAAYAVDGSPSISAARINSILCSAQSPTCGMGGDLYTDGVSYGINPLYALAFFDHESSFGTQGIARITHSLGNIVCTAGYYCISGFRAYKSWQDGFIDWYKLIYYYVKTLGKKTIDQIIPTYAPASQNDVDAYIHAIESDVQRWQ